MAGQEGLICACVYRPSVIMVGQEGLIGVYHYLPRMITVGQGGLRCFLCLHYSGEPTILVVVFGKSECDGIVCAV